LGAKLLPGTMTLRSSLSGVLPGALKTWSWMPAGDIAVIAVSIAAPLTA
jgi:hypothetical protein